MTTLETPTRHRVPQLLHREAYSSERLRDPSYQAYLILRLAFVVAPILFGLDKYFNWMTFWPKYLWTGFSDFLSVTPQQFMWGVGGVEILAGLLVLAVPRYAPYVVTAWLGGIVTNLIVVGATAGAHGQVFWDIGLRDFGLMLAALALARLASTYTSRPKLTLPGTLRHTRHHRQSM
ncbi:MAG TPA: hypothetical protein VFJ21_05940 [Mycobacteriales bacterium]|jgi:uncharacterized membrane protein YphA (DoxX/SURF4 family)|nr:hypothetical protein [Mycobacteriales bacterium]